MFLRVFSFNTTNKNMHIDKKIQKLQEEIQILTKINKHQPNTKKLHKALLKAFRENGFLAVEHWEQNNHQINMLMWKMGLPIAIRIQAEEEPTSKAIEDLLAIKNEKDEMSYIMKAIITTDLNTPQQEKEAAEQEFILWITTEDQPAHETNENPF